VIVVRNGTVRQLIVLGTALAGLAKLALSYSDGVTPIGIWISEVSVSSYAAPPQTRDFSARVHARIHILVKMGQTTRHQVEEEVSIIAITLHP
jgi:hypothetical protein